MTELDKNRYHATLHGNLHGKCTFIENGFLCARIRIWSWSGLWLRDIKNYLIERKEMWKYDKIYRIFLEMIRMKKILYTIHVWTLFIEKKFKCGMCNI